jgi:hypothetical protein
MKLTYVTHENIRWGEFIRPGEGFTLGKSYEVVCVGNLKIPWHSLELSVIDDFGEERRMLGCHFEEPLE